MKLSQNTLYSVPTQSITQNKDIDFLILLKLNDRDLKSIFAVNSYFYTFSNHDELWRRRILYIADSVSKNAPNKNILTHIKWEEIDECRKHLGFKTVKDLYKYLITFPNVLIIYSVLLSYKHTDECIQTIYKFDKHLLPKYINHDEIIFYLRREVIKNTFEKRNDNMVEIPKLYLSKYTPGYHKFNVSHAILNEAEYNILKLMQIRT